MQASENDTIAQTVLHWITEFVVGLKLCPFAAQPLRQERINILVCDSEDTVDVLTQLAT